MFDGSTYLFYKNAVSEREFNKTFKGGFGEPEWTIIETDKKVNYFVQHAAVVQNVTNAILGREELYIRGEEGLNQCMFADAILLSAWKDTTVEMPINDDEYWEELQKRIKTSKTKTKSDITFTSLGNSFANK